MALPTVSGADVVKALARAGFTAVSQKGSHVKMRHTTGYITVVPQHREVAFGTLRAIIRQARLTEEEFVRYLNDA